MKKVFIVEDNEAIREMLEILLVSENYEVRSFGSVSEFTGRDIAITPDLYLFDVMLPDGSGIDLCWEIKKNNSGVPVIIMSAHANLSDMKDRCQPDYLIAKPFDIDYMLEKVKAYIN